jgi:flagellar basal-body rod protein FlgC
MDLLPGISTTADALSAEKTRLNVIAQNIANAFTTKGVDGSAYRRKMVTFESYMPKGIKAQGEVGLQGVRVGKIVDDASPLKRVYNPQHPDADAQGMVSLPNVDVSREMVDMITASRAYEANLQMVKTSRLMVQQALQIGKR